MKKKKGKDEASSVKTAIFGITTREHCDVNHEIGKTNDKLKRLYDNSRILR